MAGQSVQAAKRRQLRFSNYEEVLAHARMLSQAPTQQLGNWSLGQIYKHLAVAIDAAIDGPSFTPPLWLRLLGPLVKKRMISRPMASGFKLPKNAGALLPSETDTAAGLAALERSVARLQQTATRQRHAVFGNMTRDQWDQLQLRHCELHLSFAEPA